MGSYNTVIHHTQDGQTVDVQMGWITAGTTSNAEAAIVLDQTLDSWVAHILPELVDDLQLTGGTIFSYENPTVGAEDARSAQGGNATGVPVPMFVVGRVTLKTGLRGRSFQGRWGIPGLATSDIASDNGNALGFASRSSLQAAVDAFYADTDQANPAVVSRISGGVVRAIPLTTQATSWSVGVNLGSRISRKD